MDWQVWHDAYDSPDSWLTRRLRAVQDRIRYALDTAPPGPLRAVSVCAGQGRDLVEVLADHPRRDDVRARLVELDPGNASYARESADRAGLSQVEVVTGDAALTDHYLDLAPADLVLVCGVFGNIVDADIERTVDTCTRLCRTGGTVVWTRNRHAPDRVPLVCDWFEGRGFERLWLSDPDAGFGVGAHRFTGGKGGTGEGSELAAGQRMFDFVGYDVLKAEGAGADSREAGA
ncbi:methyltransferase domain-containing protein [Streptomyces sp. NPDC050256]|uniref:methyltransferase domain-containing protein n=1 Tax=Streptomyces sp. NPDC050256 TaxID=3365607 RepID=UPI00378CFF37